MYAIVTGADYKYIPGVIALYNSIKANANISCDIYLLAHGKKEEFKDIPKEINIIYNAETINSPASSEWPEKIPAMYSRLLIPSMFIKYDKVLWLDADVIILKDLKPLFDLDLNDYPCAAALPSNLSRFTFMPIQLEKPEYYPEMTNILAISAGVVLFNINKWNELNLDSTINELLVSDIKFKYVVQGLMGYALKGNFKQVGNEWNCSTSWVKRTNEINILHYIGGRNISPKKYFSLDSSNVSSENMG